MDVSLIISTKEGSICVYSPNIYDVALCANSSKTSLLIPQSVSKPYKAILLHNRLGHPGKYAINQLAAKVSLSKLHMFSYTLCPTFTLSKDTLRKGKSSSHEYAASLQLIQVDICVPFNYGTTNKIFFDYSRCIFKVL